MNGGTMKESSALLDNDELAMTSIDMEGEVGGHKEEEVSVLITVMTRWEIFVCTSDMVYTGH